MSFIFFFFNDTATTEIYTLSLHDALPISSSMRRPRTAPSCARAASCGPAGRGATDRKSTRLNSSHANISYAVFCLKKKKKKKNRKIKNNEIKVRRNKGQSEVIGELIVVAA